MNVLLINGSPKKRGCTYTALSIVAEALNAEGIETEILQLPREPVSGCQACYACKGSGKARCACGDDIVNVIIEKIGNADGLVLGSPVYYASPNGQLLAILDRVFFAGSTKDIFAGKPAAAVCAARRAGTTAALEVLQKYFTISGMPIAPSTYWPMIHGMTAEEAKQDAEGVQVMHMVGETMAWMLKCFKAGRDSGIAYPYLPMEDRAKTNFIRV